MARECRIRGSQVALPGNIQIVQPGKRIPGNSILEAPGHMHIHPAFGVILKLPTVPKLVQFLDYCPINYNQASGICRQIFEFSLFITLFEIKRVLHPNSRLR